MFPTRRLCPDSPANAPVIPMIGPSARRGGAPRSLASPHFGERPVHRHGHRRQPSVRHSLCLREKAIIPPSVMPPFSPRRGGGENVAIARHCQRHPSRPIYCYLPLQSSSPFDASSASVAKLRYKQSPHVPPPPNEAIFFLLLPRPRRLSFGPPSTRCQLTRAPLGKRAPGITVDPPGPTAQRTHGTFPWT